MLTFDESGDVVYPSLDSNIIIVCTCVLQDLGRIPSLVAIRAEHATKGIDVEDDSSVGYHDEPEDGHLLSPCQPDVRTTFMRNLSLHPLLIKQVHQAWIIWSDT